MDQPQKTYTISEQECTNGVVPCGAYSLICNCSMFSVRGIASSQNHCTPTYMSTHTMSIRCQYKMMPSVQKTSTTESLSPCGSTVYDTGCVGVGMMHVVFSVMMLVSVA